MKRDDRQSQQIAKRFAALAPEARRAFLARLAEMGLNFAELPIVFRIAISRLFSITRRMSEATMLSAATMTMRPMVIEMAIFSSHRARNSG